MAGPGRSPDWTLFQLFKYAACSSSSGTGTLSSPHDPKRLFNIAINEKTLYSFPEDFEMKYWVAVALLLGLVQAENFQVTVTTDDQYQPNTLYPNIGDTIEFLIAGVKSLLWPELKFI